MPDAPLPPPTRTAISAHRGGAGLWPENSREAFRRSAGMGVDTVEFDVHRSCDGHLVVHHDAELGRTAEGSGRIADMRWADLRAVPLIGTEGEGIPSLDEVVAILEPHPVGLRLEIKQPMPGAVYQGIEGEIVARLGDADLLARTTFTCFDERPLIRLRSAHGIERLILLIRTEPYDASGRDLDRACARAQYAGAPEIAIRANQITDGDAERCRANGIRFGAFAVNDEVAIDRALAWRVQAFTTDRPDLALLRRAERETGG